VKAYFLYSLNDEKVTSIDKVAHMMYMSFKDLLGKSCLSVYYAFLRSFTKVNLEKEKKTWEKALSFKRDRKKDRYRRLFRIENICADFAGSVTLQLDIQRSASEGVA